MILFISNADTELVTIRASVEDLPESHQGVRWFNPERTDPPDNFDDIELVVVRLLGGVTAWEDGLNALISQCQTQSIPLIAVGGEATPDAELAAMSTVPAGIVAETHRYLVAGGPANMCQLLRFLSDTVLLTGFGFSAPEELPMFGVWDGAGLGQSGTERTATRPLVAVVFYRAHVIAGNTTYVSALCDEITSAGGDPLAIYTYSLRADAEGNVPALDLCADAGVDSIITSIFAAGGASEQDDNQWSVPNLAQLDVPIFQAPSSSRSKQEWLSDEAGLSPIDIGMGVAICEFDGRLIAPSYAFKETIESDGGDLVVTRVDEERTAKVARMAVRHARLRHLAPPDKRVAIVLSAYPTKRSRLGNAVGLDTPASAIELLHALAEAGYQVDRIPADGDALMTELADTLTYDLPTLSQTQIDQAAGGLDAKLYTEWFESLGEQARSEVEALWGAAPGDVYHHNGQLVFPGIDLGGVLVTIQPPRGFGPDPIGTYHAPDMPPPHHYLAFYRWLSSSTDQGGWGADAAIHLGKHGTLEWLPGKANALSADCFPDVALDDLPFIYPFVVNDPGEGTQAKRRTHATIIDHLPPPLTRADTYDEIARLEQLLDAYAQAEAMDPAKLGAIRQQVWQLLVEAEIHRDLDLGDEAPLGDDFDDMIVHVDGYICALKDAQIRGGLHLLGRGPQANQLTETVLAITRLSQGSVPSLRQTVADRLGIDLQVENRADVDRVEQVCRDEVEALAATGWDPTQTEDPTLHWVGEKLVPNLEATSNEIANTLKCLDGRYIPAGPSGAPSRGGAHVLPTGKNFYSVDPKAIPSRLAWQVGVKLADQLVQKHIDETDTAPTTVGLVLWGTAAMRTTGDDAAEALALLGVRPVWNDENQRVVDLEVIPLEDLGRPRVDITLRISGFFRDAFPHVIDLLDDAVRLVANLDEPADMNPLVESTDADARIFGPPPGGYGSGILPVLESKNWRSDAELAEVYLAWSGFAYRRGSHGEAQPDAMRRRFSAIDVAVKNQDNREHDIFDSDDYLQDHGGMVAAVRLLRGEEPKAWFGDTADPSNPKVRTLAEEAARVVRSRVVNPKWIDAMKQHGYKGAFELAATVDYLFGYDATARVVEDWMYERVTEAYVGDKLTRDFFERSNPWALRSIAERLLEADQRGMWNASEQARSTLKNALLESEGWEESR